MGIGIQDGSVKAVEFSDVTVGQGRRIDVKGQVVQKVDKFEERLSDGQALGADGEDIAPSTAVAAVGREANLVDAVALEAAKVAKDALFVAGGCI